MLIHSPSETKTTTTRSIIVTPNREMSSSLTKSIPTNRSTGKGPVPGSHSQSSTSSNGSSLQSQSHSQQNQQKHTGPTSVFQSKKARQTRQLVAEAAAYAVGDGLPNGGGMEATGDMGGIDDYEGGKLGRRAKQNALAADQQSVKDLDRWAERETGFIDDGKDDF